MAACIKTPLTELLGIKHPVMLAGMNGVSHSDLAAPQIGGNARKTNHDYTHGHLPELIDIIVAEGARLFICAVGVPPKWAVDKLHAGGVIVANMVGSVRNTEEALEAGVDMVIAQGSEGGGHTGDIGTLPLIPQVA